MHYLPGSSSVLVCAEDLIVEHIHEAYNACEAHQPASSSVAREILWLGGMSGIAGLGTQENWQVVTHILESAGGPRQWQCDNSFRMGLVIS